MLKYSPGLSDELEKQIVEHALSDTNEVCGAIINNSYQRFNNTSPEPDKTFLIDNPIFDKAIINGTLQAVIHSHRNYAHASKDDMIRQRCMDVPYGIVNVVNNYPAHLIFWGAQTPIAPYEGRFFFFGIHDCLQLAYDYYKINYDVEIPNPARDYDEYVGMFENYISQAPFYEVVIKDLLPDDLVFYTHDNKIIHIGIFLNNTHILHHWSDQISGIYPTTYRIKYLKFGMRLKQ